MLKKLIAIAKEAGVATLEYYNDVMSVEYKSDNSPLTLADKASNRIIEQGLKTHFPEISIISEESKLPEYSERKNWETFWLVDPLDGTKEFVKRNGEFTVNIALIEKGKPVLGVIYVPVTDIMYTGGIGFETFKIDADGTKQMIKVSNKTSSDSLNVVQSRSHSGEEENDFYANYKIESRLSKGSSLKICMIAEGLAEIYFRSGPTWEWDTGAGHAILLGAGGYFVNKDTSPLLYNKELPKHFGFIASAFPVTNS